MKVCTEKAEHGLKQTTSSRVSHKWRTVLNNVVHNLPSSLLKVKSLLIQATDNNMIKSNTKTYDHDITPFSKTTSVKQVLDKLRNSITQLNLGTN